VQLCSKLWLLSILNEQRNFATPSSLQVETLSHFLKKRPQFHHARIVVHNKVLQELYQRLQKQVTSDWRLLEESPMSRTGLSIALVPTTLVQEAGREVMCHVCEAGRDEFSPGWLEREK
jgi:hypothetical protein